MKSTRQVFCLSFILIFSLFADSIRSAHSQAPTPTLLDGFSAEGEITQRRWEEQFRAVPAASPAREHSRRLTAEPHVAGTKEDYATAVYVRDQMRSYGLAAELREYDVLLPYPKRPSVVELVAPRRERLGLNEAVIAEDPTSSSSKIIPLFNGYSPSG
ncbi:MAG TPA: hypothetical protein VFV61_06125, partial [Pyrinomonadaceae bacterium]|nr:hypothetical protein [Pyrinomonadaceae bacterium]